MKDDSFCNRLEKIAKKNGGGPAFARKLGVSYAVLRKWIRGQSEPTVDIIKRICNVYHLSADWLLFGEAFEEGNDIIRRSITVLEEALEESGLTLPPEAKAEVVLALGRMIQTEGEAAIVQTTNIIKLFRR